MGFLIVRKSAFCYALRAEKPCLPIVRRSNVQKTLDQLSDIFVSNKDLNDLVTSGLRAGKLRKLASRLYTKDLRTPPETLVQRNTWAIAGAYFPGALIADRTGRANYLAALKAISNRTSAEPLVRTLDFAQRFTRAIDWRNFAQAGAELRTANAFMDSAEADERGVRLRLPLS